LNCGLKESSTNTCGSNRQIFWLLFEGRGAFAAFDAATQCVAQSSKYRCELFHIRNGALRQDLRDILASFPDGA